MNSTIISFSGWICSIFNTRHKKGVGLMFPPKVPPTWSNSIALSTNSSAVLSKQKNFTLQYNTYHSIRYLCFLSSISWTDQRFDLCWRIILLEYWTSEWSRRLPFSSWWRVDAWIEGLDTQAKTDFCVKLFSVKNNITYLKARNIAPSSIYSHKYVHEWFSPPNTEDLCPSPFLHQRPCGSPC